MGNSVRKGSKPKACRVGDGKFELMANPDHDEATRQKNRTSVRERARELRAGMNRNVDKSDSRNRIPPSIEVCLTESELRSMEHLTPEKTADCLVWSYVNLRRVPYRYDRPYDPVSEHEWGVYT